MADYNSSHTGNAIDTCINTYQNATDVQEAINTAIAAVKLAMYPVGSIYMSIESTNPSTFIGGTWTQIEDTFLLACGSTYSNGDTGGSATNAHTHKYVHTHTTPATTTGSHKLTIAEMPNHRHQEYYTWAGSGSIGGNWKVNMSNTSNGGAGTWTHSSGLTDVGAVGGGGGHTHSQVATTTDSQSADTTDAASDTNNMPPYLAVYMWKRTA